MPNMATSKMVDPRWLPPWQKTCGMPVYCPIAGSMEVPETFAQMLEACCAKKRYISVGQMDILHRFNIQIDQQCISKECVTQEYPDV